MLYIMRHGKTNWNEEWRLQGRTDIPLNEEGRRIALAAAHEYADVNLDICYCSPLIRAKETAEILLRNRNVPIIVDERLVEMGFGIYEGTSNYDRDKDDEINVLFENPEKYIVPVEGGESMEELYARTGAFLKEVVEPALENGKDILIVGHGAMNSSIICQVKGLPLSEFWSNGIVNCKMMRMK